MPCVLPVLSIKLLSIIKHGGEDIKHIRTNFISSAAGIIFSFLMLAGIVSMLRNAGVNAGWGFHFQEPAFLVAMLLIMLLFTANIWGLFEINLPSSLTNTLHRLTGNGDTVAGHFSSGVLATLLATPCSAPFLGTAIGFAFTSGTTDIFLTFAFMGLGLASPYIAIAMRPSWVNKLPKPGHWMMTVKTTMGFLLLGTAIWLLWVLSAQIGDDMALTMLSLCTLVIMLLYIRKHQKTQVVKRFIAYSILGVLIAAFYIPITAPDINDVTHKTNWLEFDEQKIHKLVADGKIVFVDITADWCITCKANKVLVLDTAEISEKFAEPHIVTMRGDLTNPNAAISAYLASFKRYGIPFNAVYGAGTPDGLPLPELLTKHRVLSALEKAGGN